MAEGKSELTLSTRPSKHCEFCIYLHDKYFHYSGLSERFSWSGWSDWSGGLGGQLGPGGLGGLGGPGGQVVRVDRMVQVVQAVQVVLVVSLDDMRSENIWYT